MGVQICKIKKEICKIMYNFIVDTYVINKAKSFGLLFQ